jgi:nitrogen PTS system EIIA component
MALIDLISSDIVKIPLSSTSKLEIIKELIHILGEAGKITDEDTIFNAVMKREALGSTGLAEGIAVPHAKTDAVSDLILAIGIKPEGVDFDALDAKPSQLFFLMLAPPDQSGPHIEALAEIARLTRSGAFCRGLIGARSAQGVVDLFLED